MTPFDADQVTAPTELDLEYLPTGLFLEAALASHDLADLDDGQLVEVVVAESRTISHHEARRARANAELLRRYHAPEFAHLEIGVPLRMSRRSSERLMNDSWAMVDRVPRVLELLDDGEIDWPRARVLTEGTMHLPEVSARAVVDLVADEAPDLTPGQLRARLRRLATTLDEDAAKAERDHAIEEREVVAHQHPCDTGTIILRDLPSQKVNAAMSYVNGIARSLMSTGDTRTMDQLRADVAADLLAGACHHGERPRPADISISLETLMGLSDEMAEIPGWGPVLADVGRKVFDEHPDGPVRIRVVDPDTHRTLADVPTRRMPTAAQRRAVRGDRPTCVFPGCRKPAPDSDIDQRTRHADGGETVVENLHPLCRVHHRAKDEGGWEYQPLPGDGYAWSSPLGLTRTIRTRAP